MTWVWSWSLRDARAIPAVNKMATALFRAGALVDGMVASFISVQPIVFKEPPTGLVLCARFTMTPIGDSFDVECAMGGAGARRYRIEARTPYGSGDRSSVMEKFLNLVRSNNMVQAVLCIAFGLFLMIYPSITVQGIILLFGVALAVMGAAGLVSYFRQRSVRYRDSGTLMSAVFYVIIALIAFIFPKVIAGLFSVVLGVVLILLAIVNVVRAFGLRAFGSSIWIAVLATAVLVGIGGVLIVVNPWGASMTFVLVLGATFIVNGAVDLFIEWYTRDSEKKAGGISRR